MKQTVWILAVLLVLAMLFAVPVVAHRSQRWPDCTGKIVTVLGPRGESVECVCVAGILATCFDSGP